MALPPRPQQLFFPAITSYNSSSLALVATFAATAPLLAAVCAYTYVQGLMHMARTEGMRGMMKGNWTNCVRIIPNSAMKFFTYEQLSR